MIQLAFGYGVSFLRKPLSGMMYVVTVDHLGKFMVA